ncbi:hypothetical protein AJ80_06941 [Polytolypa hystricis UAMH7299]|uniref:Pentatricopeptide repeat domain-containing protein n=1 Tax=Polytolypa hystricis (strain UAMH7299) TaxID=1447883 RepID=A0A2B7XRM0_POLH7|nr:hypothetical protein AJ80_06941 [Polytolypa hystricis UAMH7299]
MDVAIAVARESGTARRIANIKSNHPAAVPNGLSGLVTCILRATFNSHLDIQKTKRERQTAAHSPGPRSRPDGPLMRGIGFRREAISPHSVCPSCYRQIVGETLRSRPPWQASNIHTSPASSSRRSTHSSSLSSPARSRVENPSSFPFVSLSMPPVVHRRNPKLINSDLPYLSLNPADVSQPVRVETFDHYIAEVLQEAQPRRVLKMFMREHPLTSGIYAAPPSTFIAALRLLSPEYFLEPYKKLQRHFHPVISKKKKFTSLESRFQNFAAQLSRIVQKRRLAGFRLGLTEYTHLLDCARAMGDANMAEHLWEDMIGDEVEPSTECYNHYMEARLWEMGYVGREKLHHRVNERYIIKRAMTRPQLGWGGYRVGTEGVKLNVAPLFHEMVARGLQPNENTYAQIMLAHAREGEMDDVEEILKNVWNIHVSILRDSESNHPAVTVYSHSSPLHPTSRLITALAHLYGANGDVPTGLQLIDFISRHYAIPIEPSVWEQLIEWAHVLSIKRLIREDPMGGPRDLPKDMPRELLLTLTSEPYNVQPTMVMYAYVFRSQINRQSFGNVIRYMRFGRDIFMQTLAKELRHRELLETYHSWARGYVRELSQEEHRQSIEPSSSSAAKQVLRQTHRERNDNKSDVSANTGQTRIQRYHKAPPAKLHSLQIIGYEEMKRVDELNKLHTARDATMLQRFTRLLIGGKRWGYRNESRIKWERRGIHRALEEWQPFLPWVVYYSCEAGSVEFDPATFWPGGKRPKPEDLIVATKEVSEDEGQIQGRSPGLIENRFVDGKACVGSEFDHNRDQEWMRYPAESRKHRTPKSPLKTLLD